MSANARTFVRPAGAVLVGAGLKRHPQVELGFYFGLDAFRETIG
jgi:hypothetical protein